MFQHSKRCGTNIRLNFVDKRRDFMWHCGLLVAARNGNLEAIVVTEQGQACLWKTLAVKDYIRGEAGQHGVCALRMCTGAWDPYQRL